MEIIFSNLGRDKLLLQELQTILYIHHISATFCDWFLRQKYCLLWFFCLTKM